MCFRRWFATCVQALTLAGLPLSASAHLMPAGQGAVRVVGDSAYAVISVPVAVLAGFDDNHDGLIDADEIRTWRQSLGTQLSRMLDFRESGEPGKLVFEDLLLSHVDEKGFKGGDHIVVVRRYQWARPVQSLTLRADLFGVPQTMNTQLLMRGIRGEESEAAVLSRHHIEYTFFAGPLLALRNHVLMGAEHILLGADHLLFLLTILIVGAGWRYWLAVITSFTVAHSVTLTLAALEWVKAPSAMVEPLIAASIVLLALDNLVRGAGAARHRLVLVFACGLLHGLGIASALTDIGLSGGSRASTLIGFNLGVELGQMLFVACALSALYLARRVLHESWHGRLVQACSLLAAIVGAGWMVERLIGVM
jgi:hydrogenase/urease accessory protein HupE